MGFNDSNSKPGNNAVITADKTKFSLKIQSPQIQELIYKTLGDPKRAQRFVASISSVVATNPKLAECEISTIINGALLGEALNLVPSPQLGQYYLVPFKDNTNNRIVATFILGYKGYIQLAIRSGYYKRINVLEIKEGELLGWNPLTEELNVKITDDTKQVADGVFVSRDTLPTIGYVAQFEYLNGFIKTMYFSYAKMLNHANEYSAAFKADAYAQLKAGKIPKNEMWKYSSFWYENFDEMAKKTMLRQLISKWGVMSVEMQQAFEHDLEYETSQVGAQAPQGGPIVENQTPEPGSQPAPDLNNIPGQATPAPKPETKPDASGSATPTTAEPQPGTISDAEAERRLNAGYPDPKPEPKPEPKPDAKPAPKFVKTFK